MMTACLVFACVGTVALVAAVALGPMLPAWRWVNVTTLWCLRAAVAAVLACLVLIGVAS